MRGPLRWAQNRSNAPSPGLRRNPASPRAAGRGKAKAFPRRVRARVLQSRSPDGAKRNPGTMTKAPTPLPDFTTFHPGYDLRARADKRNRSRDADAPESCKQPRASFCLPEKKPREAERRKAHHPLSAPHQQTLPLVDARARKRTQRGALAYRRSTAALPTDGIAADQRQLRPRFLGR
jgi:hypothetical protein